MVAKVWLLVCFGLVQGHDGDLERKVLAGSRALADSYENSKFTGYQSEITFNSTGSRSESKFKVEYFRLGDKYKGAKYLVGQDVRSPQAIGVATPDLCFAAQRGSANSDLAVTGISRSSGKDYLAGSVAIHGKASMLLGAYFIDYAPFHESFPEEIKNRNPVWSELEFEGGPAVRVQYDTKSWEGQGSRYFDRVRIFFRKDSWEILRYEFDRLKAATKVPAAKFKREITYDRGPSGEIVPSGVVDEFVDQRNGKPVFRNEFKLESAVFGQTDAYEFTLDGCGLDAVFEKSGNRRVWIVLLSLLCAVCSYALIRKRARSAAG